MDGQYLIKFCLYYIIDNIYVFIEKGHFLQICNRVTALDLCQKLFLAQYLENGWTEFDQILFCIHITIDKVWVGIVFFFFIFATELQPLIYIEIGVCSIS